MRYVGALIWGAVLGGAAVMIYTAFPPSGLILALAGSGVGVWLIGKSWGMRRYKVLASLMWGYVVLRGGTPGVGGELLVQGNTLGNALVFAGIGTLAIAVVSQV